mgnify:CR=1 FL=1
MGYLYLILSILVGTVANVLLKYSDGFKKPLPTIGNIVLFSIGIWLLALAVTTINLGAAYATWAGLGIIFAAAAGKILFQENPSKKSIAGMALTVVGVIMLNVF